MGIGIPCHFNIGMAEPAGDLLDIDPFIGQKRHMGMSEIVDAYLLYACCLRKSFVAVFDRCVTQALFSAAHPIGCAETLVFFPTFFMLLQYSEQWNGDLECPNRRFVLRSGFPVSAFQLLRDAAFYGQEAVGYVAPLQGVYFAFPETRIKRNGKEHIE